jgi:hypothetical protein
VLSTETPANILLFGRDCANPLCLAEVGERRDLLFVDCAYALDMEARIDATRAGVSSPAESFDARARQLGVDRPRMSIAPDSIEFYMFEQIEAECLRSATRLTCPRYEGLGRPIQRDFEVRGVRFGATISPSPRRLAKFTNYEFCAP